MKKHHLTAAIQTALMPARAAASGHPEPEHETPNAKSWYSISALSGAVPTVEIYIYDVIGYWGVSAQQFISDCKAAGVFDAKQLNIHIHSPGGDIMDGFAIYNTLARLTCKIDIWNDGLAASMASVILCLPNATVHMPSNAWVMIHKPWSGTVGNADDLRDMADWLDRNEALLLNAYEKKTGKTREELAALLSADTWLDGPQAKELGFVDVLEEPILAAAYVNENKMNDFTNMPTQARALFGAKATAGQPPASATPASVTTQPAAAPSQAEALAAFKQAEQGRRNEIQDLFALTGGRFPELMAECLGDMDVTPAQTKEKIKAALGKPAGEAGPTGPAAHIHVGNGNLIGDSIRASLLARCGHAAAEGDNRYGGYSLRELARASLDGRGIQTGGHSPMAYVGMAFTHTSSDFGKILLDVANKSVLEGWENAEETFDKWTRKGTLSDFKVASRIGLSDIPSLRKVREGAEYKHVTLSDTGATIQLATYGELFAITRQAIINDDLDMLTRVPALFGAAARGTIGDLVYAVLTGNVKMPDNKTLFHADHKNLLTGADAAMGIKGLSAAKTLMRGQRAVGADDKPGRALNIRPGYALVPIELEDTALQLINSTSVPGADANSGIANPIKGFVDVIGEPRLSDASTEAWYLAAKGGDTIEVAYLDGQDTPWIEQQEGFTVDGVTTKVRIDAGVSALDYRGLVKSAGK
ncbi:ClpP-like prohead protease/major capsid protein fusion protein [Aeromonas rivipollensis]|uniref:ClpP-like prohead protease/major capsid protein fusion protein n=1 Tax=Aeromonas rivipollensis TaxID=948519 RepID=UPI001F4702CB|nr:ClpP-like prohead protease/major capsid protein fusion protein [Aeromonas rivipollensis]MCE9956003.1 ATP-dependent Clp protease proteolytic subunit [Aeromonas rivipollensis]